MAKGTGSWEWSPNSTGVEWSPVTTMLQGSVQCKVYGVYIGEEAFVGVGVMGGRGHVLQLKPAVALGPHKAPWYKKHMPPPPNGVPVAPVAPPLLLPQQAHQLAHHGVHNLLVAGLQGSAQ